MLGDVDRHGDAVVPGQALSPCTEHQGTCLRCHEPMSVKPRKKFQGEERRARKTISIRVPQDAQEDGAGVWDELIDQLRDRYGQVDAPPYYVLVKAMYEVLTSVYFDHESGEVRFPDPHGRGEAALD